MKSSKSSNQEETIKSPFSPSASPKKKSGKISLPTTSSKKYTKYDVLDSNSTGILLRPSVLLASFSAPEQEPAKQMKRRAPPEIIEFLNIRDYSNNIKSTVDIDEPLFQPFPQELVFPNYEPYSTYTQTLYLRNIDSVPRRIKVLSPDSPFFSVSPPIQSESLRKIGDGKIASGMEVSYTVTFKPQEKRDYKYDLVIATEREKFIVPMTAAGLRGVIDFPDQVEFKTVPVKYESSSTIMVRNLGNGPTTFRLVPSAPFSAVVEKAHLYPGEQTQVTINFLPSESKRYESEMLVEYEDGSRAYIRLSGTGENIAVHLSRHMLHMDPTYISLTSSQTLKIFNRSDIPVSFDWKSFGSTVEEQEERSRLHMELSHMEALERASLDDQDFPLEEDEKDEDDENYIPFAKQAALMALARKYTNLRKEVEDDKMHFADETFVITPLSGSIWAHSEITITVTFNPLNAANFACISFLEIIGRDNRLPMKLEGLGIGPKATFSYDVLDIGDVFINSVHKYELVLENKGDIPASYLLDEQTVDHSHNFDFTPSSGNLAVKESAFIEVTFSSNILGEFNEHFVFTLVGGSEKLAVHFKGHIVGPTFNFNVEEIDYGIVSYEFLNSKEIALMNTSEIAMNFNLRIPQDGKMLQKEFDIKPNSGEILPGQKQLISIDFISTTVKKYEVYLTVDVDGVGQGLLSIPIYAECKVPNVSLLMEELKYGDCFLRYPYSQSFVLKNNSDLQARYEIVPQDDRSQAVGIFTTNPNKGIIEPLGQCSIDVSLRTEKLGQIKLPVVINISGSNLAPLMTTIVAKGQGPKLIASSDIIDFGPCTCLSNSFKTMTLTNSSLIPASFRTLIKSARSKYSVDIKEGVMNPGESLELTITVNPDDNIVLTEQLHIIVVEGENVIINLTAKGTGTTLFCEENLSLIEFGNRFTNHAFERTFLLENKGRRAQILTWINLTARESEKEAKLKSSTGKKDAKGSPKKIVEIPTATFSVTPETIELRPRTACHFTIRGNSTVAGNMLENFVCETKIGQSDKKGGMKAVSMDISANILNPMLQPSESTMKFNYKWANNNPAVPQTKPLTLTNVTALPLDFVLRTSSPYTLDQWEFHMPPGESATVNVEFDPGYKDDNISHIAKGNITAIYNNHPQKDVFELIGDIAFPNLQFEYTAVDFGCILNDTTKSMTMKVTNISTITCNLNWIFVEDEEGERSVATERKPYIPVNQIFDILPIRSQLRPGESENVELIIYGHKNRKFTGAAICEVEGGPEYEVSMTGEASDVSYKLDATSINFGRILYTKIEDREFSIHNTGKVAFNYHVRTDLLSRSGVVAVSPVSGRIFAKSSQKIQVRFLPGIPDYIMEKLLIEVAHFEPIEFPIYGEGIYSSVSVTLPLDSRDSWDDLKTKAKFRLEEYRKVNKDTSAEYHPVLLAKGGPGVIGGVAVIVNAGESADTLVQPLPEIDNAQVETEAMRLDFTRYLLENNQVVQLGGAAAPVEKVEEENEDDQLTNKEIGFIISKYTVDFGNVIIGTAKRKAFTITNSSALPVSFNLDKKTAAAHGFVIEPEKVARLPEKMSTEFTITFKASKKSLIGPLVLDLPICMKEGPTTMMKIRANVTVPNVVISPDTIDFGRILVGQVKICYVTIYNNSPVSSEWECKNARGMGRDAGKFAVTPSEGTLTPGERINVQIAYTPTDDRKNVHKIPFKVNHNSKQYFVNVKGSGAELDVVFEPPIAQLGPILPNSEAAKHVVSIHNKSEYPVELYSLDFDNIYKDEDSLYSLLTNWEPDGTLRLATREPGAGLQESILELKRAQTALSNKSEVSSTETVQVQAPQPTISFSEQLEKPWDKIEKGFHTIIVGGSSCGKSTAAKSLENEYGYSVISLDSIFSDALEKLSPMGCNIYAILHPPPPPEPVVVDPKKLKKGEVPPEVKIEEPKKLDFISVAAILKEYLMKCKYSTGLVIDGLAVNEKYKLQEEEILKGLLFILNTKDICESLSMLYLDNQGVTLGTPTPSDQVLKTFSTEESKTTETVVTSVEPPKPSIWGSKENVLQAFKLASQPIVIPQDTSVSTENISSETTNVITPVIATNMSLFELMISGDLKQDTVKIFSTLPKPPPAPWVVPDPAVYQLMHKPFVRAERRTTENFKLVKLDDAERNKSSIGNYRWIIPPKKSINISIEFTSKIVGRFDFIMGFEILGKAREYSLTCSGACDVPTINTEARNVFMARIKNLRNEKQIVTKKYIISKDLYDFGPLLIGKDETKRTPEAAKKNAETFRISNNGKFLADVSFAFSDSGTPFIVEPDKLKIAPGATENVTVWAFPKTTDVFNTKLVATIKDNPDLVYFPVQCTGATPSLEAHGPWELAENANSDTKKVVAFDRLLLGQREDKSFRLDNVSMIPVTWRLNKDDLNGKQEFFLTPDSGVIEPYGSSNISISFTAIKQADFRSVPPKMFVQYSDSEGGMENKISTIPLEISAEAYQVSTLTTFSDQDAKGVLNYGDMKVGNSASKSFKLKNEGKYSIDFNFVFRKKSIEELFKIEPRLGVIAPGTDVTIVVAFTSKKEVFLKDNKDIKCQIIESGTKQQVKDFDLTVSVRTVFDKFRLQPLKGINFGAVHYGEDKSKRFELKNNGEFDFEFRIVPMATILKEQEDKEKGVVVTPWKPAPEPLVIGQFKITPAGGKITPGQTASIEIIFSAKGSEVYRQALRIDVSNRDPVNSDAGLIYDVVGESCIPGISASDYDSVFEEQSVVRELALGSTGVLPTSVYALEEKTFSFGHIVPTARPNGTQQRFKISNPYKVRALVKYSVDPRVEKEAGIFNVQPKSDDIPPHEYRYVTIYFKPTAVQKYQSVFKAIVDNGIDPTSNKLQFDLVGEGTLPCVTIIQPLVRTPAGELLVDFGRLQVNKSRTKTIQLRNDGSVPVTITFDMPIVDSFYCKHRGTTVIMNPGESDTVEVSFKPRAATEKPIETVMNLLITYNSYETNRVLLRGVSYKETVTFDDLPEEKEGELVFGDQDLQDDISGQNVSFNIRNHTNQPVKFDWVAHADFTFTPSIGHLQPNSTKDIIGTFKSSSGATVSFEKEKITMKITNIKYSDKTLEAGTPDWDNRMKQTIGQVTSTLPEPEFSPLGESLPLVLQCTARADKVSYKCETRSLSFRPTFMFQSRTHKFDVTNTAKTIMNLSWSLENLKSSGFFDPSRPNTTSKSNIPNLPCPYDVEPKTASIPAGTTKTFTVKFSPLEVDDYRYNLLAQIDHLTKDNLNISLQGRAQRPVCHLDLPPSDYLSRRSPDMINPNGERGPLDGNVKVIEFTSLGLKVKNTKRFFLINTTNMSYEFSWEPEGGIIHPAFSSLSKRGLVLPGKRVELAFEFTPETVDVAENFWRFNIPSQGTSMLFLLVGTVSEPRVRLDRVHLNFREMLLESKSTETVYLFNDEHIPFSFYFDKSSFESGEKSSSGSVQVISINPNTGIVPANGSLPVQVTFLPQEEKLYNYNLKCIVRKKPLALSLNVKGEGYALHDRLCIEEAVESTEKTTELSFSNTNYIDFGNVYINECAVKHIVITNTGKWSFDFDWKNISHSLLSIEPMNGSVRMNDSVLCILKFNPATECTLENEKISCSVAGGTKNYSISVAGRATKPDLDFSFYEYNFGAVFVNVPGSKTKTPERAILRVANNEMDTDLTLECLFEKLPYLDVQFLPRVLKAGTAVEVPIFFSPKEFKPYKITIPFEVNGLVKVNVTISGEGCPLKVELANPSQRTITFGSIRPNEEASRSVRIVNRSKRAATFEVIDKFEAGQGLLAANAVSFFPSRPVTLKPREICNVDLKFSPSVRIASFSEELCLSVEGGSTVPLCRISGACQGMDVRLETDSLQFGRVCTRSMLTRKLQLLNIGDVGTNFKWDLSALSPDFSVSPSAGHIAPHSEIMFEVTFSPSRVDDDIRYDGVKCYVDGLNPLVICLMGACVPQPEGEIQDLKFESQVRKKVSQNVTIKNPTREVWNITPVISNPYWSAPEVINIPAGGSTAFPLSYCPLIMTKVEDSVISANSMIPKFDNRPNIHEGTLFFALPDGNAALFRLSGKSSPPAAEALPTKKEFVLTTPCKKNLTVALPISNWLKTSQHLRVKFIAPNAKASTLMRGADFIDIPPLAYRDYKLNFYAYMEGETLSTLLFTNDETGEYLFYELKFTAGPPGIVDVITIDAVVRQSVSKSFTLENPLSKDTIITWPEGFAVCPDPDIQVKMVGNMTGASEGAFQIEYRPLNACADYKEVPLVLTCKELGTYNYKLRLRAEKASSERSMNYKTSLGASQAQNFRFKNFVKKPLTYTVSVTRPDCFIVPPTINAVAADKWDGTDVSVEVTFVPNIMGTVRDKLKIVNSEGGEFICSLVGECKAPTPQGPFTINAGGTQVLSFKNVFSEAKEFEYISDNTVFLASEAGKKIDAKAAVSITVKYVPIEGGASTGKLFVRCKDSSMPPWVFYLQGIVGGEEEVKETKTVKK